MTPTNTYGGGVDQTAVIGHAPESRDWTPYVETHAPVIAPTARIEAFVTVDAGLEHSTAIMDGAWLFKHCHIGHDAYVGPGAEVSTGAIIGGHAFIGAGARIGLGAIVLPYRKVGANAVLGAGAVLTKDLPAGETWVRNPARKLNDFERDSRPHTERKRDCSTDTGLPCSQCV